MDEPTEIYLLTFYDINRDTYVFVVEERSLELATKRVTDAKPRLAPLSNIVLHKEGSSRIIFGTITVIQKQQEVSQV